MEKAKIRPLCDCCFHPHILRDVVTLTYDLLALESSRYATWGVNRQISKYIHKIMHIHEP